MDKLILNEIEVDARIGFLAEEKNIRQKLLVSLVLSCDFSEVEKTDAQEDCVDYFDVIESSKAFSHEFDGDSLEYYANALAQFIRGKFAVNKVALTVSKPRYANRLGLKDIKVYVER
jgi:dihydroneopterin aldolase